MTSTAGTIILEWVCPLLGCIIGNIMFFAPVRSVLGCVERGYLGELNPTPWAFMCGNCLGWVTYAFLIQNYFIFFANAPGFLLSIWLNMCAAKLQYQDHRAREMRQSFVTYLEDSRQEDTRIPKKAVDWGKIVVQVTSQQTPAPAAHEKLVVGISTVWLAIISVIIFGTSFTPWVRELIVGICVNVNLCFFYGAPLSTIFKVLTSRNSNSIHVWTMVTNTLNGTFWTAYGAAVRDPFIYVPNGVGAFLGVVQFFLCFIFPRKLEEETKEEDAKEDDNAVALQEESVNDDDKKVVESQSSTTDDDEEANLRALQQNMSNEAS